MGLGAAGAAAGTAAAAGGLSAGTGAAIAGGASLLGSGISALGGMSAGGAQSKAAQQSAQAQMMMYQQTRADLAPYNQAGQTNLPDFTNFWQNTGNYLQPYIDQAKANLPPTMTQAELEQTPGYQFNLSQGLKATQNAAAARGLGVSGTALKQAANFATGLADSTYQNQFNNAQTRFSDYSSLFGNALQLNNQQFNQLYYPVSIGENAAAQTGNQGTALANQYGQATQAAGQAQAAGIGTAAGSLNQGITGAGNSALTYALLRQNNANSPVTPNAPNSVPQTGGDGTTAV